MADLLINRHQSVFDPIKYNTPVVLIGCGATGSRIFAALAELGISNIECYDGDIVEPHNLANQVFGYGDIGKPKVVALHDWYVWKTGVTPPNTMKFIHANVELGSEVSFEGKIVFLLTDSMASRRMLYEAHLHTDPAFVIETRMASTHGNVFSFHPSDEAEATAWESSLTDDETTELSPCGTSLSVGTTASVIANLAVWRMMLWHVDPGLMDAQLDIFLKPALMATRGSLS
jgi:molybdopterin/thiamine biosynthesis adenylyltransferase